MRRLSTALKVMSLLAGACVGCTASPDSLLDRRPSSAQQDTPAATGTAGATTEVASTVTVSGHLSSAGQGTIEQGLAGARILDVAKTVTVMALGQSGELTAVAQADVKPGGGFDAKVPTNSSPTGIFILRIEDVAGAIVGSGIVNGLPAFLKAFFVDATVDTVTSFKAEVLVTLAKKGVPGVQNYLNVIDAYVNAQLANSIAVDGVLSTDLTTLIGATSDAVVAAENVIVDALAKAGITVDLTALQKAQASAVAGVEGLVTSSTGELVTAAKNLVASLEAASTKAAVPIDQAIFNAIVNGGASFSKIFKTGASSAGGGAGASPSVMLASAKAVFALETALTVAAVADAFAKSGTSSEILDAITTGCATFTADVENATSLADLEAARTAFTDALLGKKGAGGGILAMLAKAIGDLEALVTNVDATLEPLAQDVTSAVATFDEGAIATALASFDAGTTALPAKLQAAVSAADASAIAIGVCLAKKQVVL